MYRLITQRYSKELNAAAAVAHLAGSVMLHYYDLDYAVSLKDGEPNPESAIVTEVDGRAERVICDHLTRLWPDDRLLTEETRPAADWYRSRRVWIIDPLDGTMGFKKKTGCFGISIALVEEGRPVLGVLFAPMKNLMAWAVAGEGAFLNAKPVRLHQHTSVKTVLCSSNSIDRPPYRKLLRIIDPRQELQVAAMESAVVKALSLLAGSGEIYPVLPISDETPSAPKFWDIAAADIVLKEAGARVTTFWGEAYTYDLPDVRCVHGVLMGTAAGHRYAMAQLQAAGYLEKRA